MVSREALFLVMGGMYRCQSSCFFGGDGNRGFGCFLENVDSVGLLAGLLRVVGSPRTVVDK